MDLQVRHCQDSIHFHNVVTPKKTQIATFKCSLLSFQVSLMCYDPCFQTQLKSCCDEFLHLCFTSCLSLLSAALPLFRVTLSPTICASVPVCEHHQHEFPEAFPSSQVDQAAETGLHHSYSAMDVCTVIQGGIFYSLCSVIYHTLEFLPSWQLCCLFSHRLFLMSVFSSLCFSSYTL